MYARNQEVRNTLPHTNLQNSTNKKRAVRDTRTNGTKNKSSIILNDVLTYHS